MGASRPSPVVVFRTAHAMWVAVASVGSRPARRPAARRAVPLRTIAKGSAPNRTTRPRASSSRPGTACARVSATRTAGGERRRRGRRARTPASVGAGRAGSRGAAGDRRQEPGDAAADRSGSARRQGRFHGAHHRRERLGQGADRAAHRSLAQSRIDPGMQVKLLRALQEREIRRVGENKTRPVDVRILAAAARAGDRAPRAAHRCRSPSNRRSRTPFRWHSPSCGPCREGQGPTITVFAWVARDVLKERLHGRDEGSLLRMAGGPAAHLAPGRSRSRSADFVRLIGDGGTLGLKGRGKE
jgi:hypothetical protein